MIPLASQRFGTSTTLTAGSTLCQAKMAGCCWTVEPPPNTWLTELTAIRLQEALFPAAPAAASLARFLATALIGLALNSLVVFGIVDLLGLAYGYAAALMATAVPATVFLVSKFWAFA